MIYHKLNILVKQCFPIFGKEPVLFPIYQFKKYH